MTSSVAGLRRSSKALPKAKLTPKNGHGHGLMVCCWFDPLQLSESWQNYYIWEVHSAADQWDAPKTAMTTASIDQQKGPNYSPQQCQTTKCCTTNALKVEQIELWSFASFTIFIWPLANWIPLLQESWQFFFAGKMLPQPAGGWKCFARVHWILMHIFLHYRNKQTYFPLAKICWLINKDVFEPSYNYLKFKVQSPNYCAPISLEKTWMLGKIEHRRRRGQQRIIWSDSFTDSIHMSLSKLQETAKGREAWHAAVHEVTKSQKRLSDWIKATIQFEIPK